MADNDNNTATETEPLTFQDMAAGSVDQLVDAEPDDEVDAQTDTPAEPSADADAPDATPVEPKPKDDAAPEAAAPKARPGSVWDHVPEATRQKVLAIAQKADGHRAAAAAPDGTGTDQPAAADTDKPVVDVAEEVLTGSLTSDEVTAKIAAVRADGYDELADALQATADFAAQQTREVSDAAGAVVELVEALDQKQVAEDQEEDDVQLFAAALDARPGASDEQLILVRRMVNQGVVTAGEGENPYDLAFQQLEGAGIALDTSETDEVDTPKAESTAKRGRRKLAAAASSASGGGADTPADLGGFDPDSIHQAMDDDHPMFRDLLKPT